MEPTNKQGEVHQKRFRGKTPRADLRRQYRTFLFAGLVLSLILTITAFRLNLTASESFDINLQEQEMVQMEEILQTEQIEKPPPPPRPPVPVEVPNDEVLEEVALDLDAFLDIDEISQDLPPPPPPSGVCENGKDDDGDGFIDGADQGCRDSGGETEEDAEPDIFVIVEQMPELIGGLEGIQRRIVYPEIAKKAGVEGRVFLQFVVDERGNVTDPIVTRGIGAGCDEEAVKAILAVKFTPGMQRGKAVKVKMSLPVTFRLK